MSKILFVIFLFVSILSYKPAFSPVYHNTVDYNQNFLLYDGAVFTFRVNYEGGYSIKLAYKDSLKTTPFTYISSPQINCYQDEEPTSNVINNNTICDFFHTTSKNYTLRFSLGSKDSIKTTINVFEETATASKNAYFDREFKPEKKVLFYILLSLTIVFMTIAIVRKSK